MVRFFTFLIPPLIIVLMISIISGCIGRSDSFRRSFCDNALAGNQLIQENKEEAKKLLQEGLLLQNQLKCDEAMQKYGKGLEIAEKLNDKELIAHFSAGLGICYYGEAEYKESLKYLEKAAKNYRDIGDRNSEGGIYGVLGMVYTETGDYLKSLECHQKALAIKEEVGDTKGEAAVIASIGVLYTDMGEYDKSISSLNSALHFFKEMGNRSLEAYSNQKLGDVYSKLGDLRKAMSYYRESLQTYQVLGDKKSEDLVLSLIAKMYEDRGYGKEALEYYEILLKLRKNLGDKNGEGRVLLSIGGVYNTLGEYKIALEYLERALAIDQEIGDKWGESEVISEIAMVYRNLGQYDKALEYEQKSGEMNRQFAKSRGDESGHLNNIGLLYQDKDDYQQAIEYHKKALKYAQDLGDKKGESTALGNLGIDYKLLGYLQEALQYQQKALEIDQKLGYKIGEGNTLNSIGNIYSELGDYYTSIQYLQKALEIRKEVGDKKGQRVNLIAIADVYESLGYQEKALEFHEKSLEIAQNMGFKIGEAGDLMALGSIYDKLGNTDKALEHYERAAKIAREIEDKKSEINALSAISGIYARKKENKKALEFLERCIKLTDEMRGKSGHENCLQSIGYAYLSLEDYKQALKYYDKALNEFRMNKNKSGERDCLITICRIYINGTKDYTKALECSQKAFKICEEMGDLTGSLVSSALLSCSYFGNKKSEDGEKWLRKSIEILESIREKMRMEEYKLDFMGATCGIYEMVISLLVQKNKYNEAWEYCERSKARTFLDMLGNQRIDYRAKSDPELIEKEKLIDRKISLLRSQMEELKDKTNIKEMVKTLQESKQEYENVIQELKISNPEYASLKSVQVSTLQDIKSVLDEKSVILEYFIGDGISILFLVDKSGLEVFQIPYTEKQIKEKIIQLRKSIVTKSECDAQIKEISNMLFPTGVFEIIKGKEKLIIVPHSVMHYLPFSLLINKNGDYLVNHYEIRTEPSASVWKLCHDKIDTAGKFLTAYALGSAEMKLQDAGAGVTRETLFLSEEVIRGGFAPLPATEGEVKEIAGLYSDNNILIGRDMNFNGVKDSIDKGNLVHFATHGVLDSDHPLFSGLVLSDEILSVSDIFAMKLNANLVVLSACNTGIGRMSSGDEILGITRAFMYAGTPTVIASLWSVSDESTAILMKNFYKRLKEGNTAAASLRAAQIDLMKEFPQPFYWAPFIVTGK